MTAISLNALIVPSKEIEVEYPGLPDFKIKVAFLSREILVGLRKKATTISFKNRQPVEELNDELFLKLYVDSAIKSWSGLKLRYLEQLVPVDLGDNDPDTELEYSPQEALSLMKASADFDSFISETVNDLGKFQKSSSKK